MSYAVPMHYVSTTNVSVGDTLTYTIELPSQLVASIQPSLNGLEVVSSLIDRRPTANVHQFELQLFSIENVMIPTVSLTEINGVAPIELSPIYFNLVSLLPITANQYNITSLWTVVCQLVTGGDYIVITCDYCNGNYHVEKEKI